MNSSKKIFGLVAAAVIAGGIVGCGGSGSNPTPGDTTGVEVSGGLQQTSATSPSDVGSSPTAQTVTLGGSSVLVPASDSAFRSGTPAAVLSENIPIIGNTSAGAAQERSPGDVIIRVLPDGPETVMPGLVNSDFSLTRRVGLFPGDYEIEIDGPWRVRSTGNILHALTVGKFIFQFTVDANGKASLPIDLTGTLPGNGQNTNNPAFYARGTFLGAFANKTATLELNAGSSSIMKSVTATPVNGTQARASWQDLQGGFFIPQNGLSSVRFSFLTGSVD